MQISVVNMNINEKYYINNINRIFNLQSFLKEFFAFT